MPYQFWEPYEEQFLSEVAETMTVEDIAEKLERTPLAVVKRAKRMGLNYIIARPTIRWTSEHKDLFKTHTISQVAKLTGRSYQSCWIKHRDINQKLAA